MEARSHAAKTAIRMRTAANLFYAIQRFGKKRAARIREVETRHGKTRVLEYGFNAPGLAPLYIDLHGGGFVLMAADVDEWKNVLLRQRTGARIISIDYPKAPENPYPIPPETVFDAVRHYIRNAAEYGIDTTNIGIGGYSAGANLAVATAMRAKEIDGFAFRYQILVYPPLDMAADPYGKRTPKGAIPPKLAAMFNACYVSPEQAKEPYCSPLYATCEQLAGLPPTLLILAGKDSLHDEGAAFAEKLAAAGVPLALHEFEESAHGFTYKHADDTSRALSLMAGFMTSERH